MIVDWKTGRGEGRFSEVQLAGYALYAAQQGWVKSADELQTELAYLAIPRYVRRSVDQKRLDHAHAFIAKSASTMKALLLDPIANQGRLEDFAMIERPQICRRCNFRRLCFPRADDVRPAVIDQPAASPPDRDQRKTRRSPVDPSFTSSSRAEGSVAARVRGSPSGSRRASMRTRSGSSWPSIESADVMAKAPGQRGRGEALHRHRRAGGDAGGADGDEHDAAARDPALRRAVDLHHAGEPRRHAGFGAAPIFGAAPGRPSAVSIAAPAWTSSGGATPACAPAASGFGASVVLAELLPSAPPGSPGARETATSPPAASTPPARIRPLRA